MGARQSSRWVKTKMGVASRGVSGGGAGVYGGGKRRNKMTTGKKPSKAFLRSWRGMGGGLFIWAESFLVNGIT